MSYHEPRRRASLALVVPVLAIAGALAFGLYIKSHSVETIGGDPRALNIFGPAGVGVVIAKSETGIGNVKGPDGKPILFERFGTLSDVAAWTKFDFGGSSSDFARFQRSLRSDVKDENGSPWIADLLWKDQSAYVLLRTGYNALPKKLTARLYVDGHEMASVPMPPLPAPKPTPSPKLIGAWNGLVVESCRLQADTGGHTKIYVDSPLPAGHILAARLVSSHGPGDGISTVQAVKGPEEGPYFQAIDGPWTYPKAAEKAYVEVFEFAPVHIRKRIGLKSPSVTDKFGETWLDGEGESTKLTPDVGLMLRGDDSVPAHAPRNPRREVRVSLHATGLVNHVKAKLIGPSSLKSIPLSLHGAIQGQAVQVLQASERKNWTAGPLIFDLDVEADIYRLVRQATVEVDIRTAKRVLDVIPGGSPAYISVGDSASGIAGVNEIRVYGTPLPARPVAGK